MLSIAVLTAICKGDGGDDVVGMIPTLEIGGSDGTVVQGDGCFCVIVIVMEVKSNEDGEIVA